MKKNYLVALFALVCNFAFSQLQQTPYKGAFAPAPTAMWTNGWTNFDPNNYAYGNVSSDGLISADITTNTTLVSSKVYELGGLITVRNNATLTIEPGTVIRSSAPNAALVITRGSKLIANGTATQPIVFTSKKDSGSRTGGDWGGIVLLGKARYNVNNGVNFIEGLSQNVNTEFGGGLNPVDNDNSGSLKYVRIEFAGYVFSPNNELNGLTMGAVGSGTTIDYVQVSYSLDDSFEWFGGSVNCKHLVAFNGLDDDFDTDNGYKGIVQFGLSIRNPLLADISTSETFESDNNSNGSLTTASYGDFTSAVFSNITCIGGNKRPTTDTTNYPSGFVTPNALLDKGLRIRRASKLSVFNSILLDFKKGLVLESLESNQFAYGMPATTEPVAAAIPASLKFKNNTIASPAAFSTSNTTTTSSPTTAQITSWFSSSDNANVSQAASTDILARPYATDSAFNFLTVTSNTDTVNIDYRPLSTDAKEGASFTDSSLSGYLVTGTAPGVTSPLNLCKGVVASALTANMTATGVSLRWYTVATSGTSTTTLIPSTASVGTKTYYVSEIDAEGIESGRAPIVVNVAAIPLTGLAAISGASAAAPLLDISALVGTTLTTTYTVAASTEPGLNGYFWNVPLGAKIESGQNTNTIVVSFKNIAQGITAPGLVTVQAKNEGGCLGKVTKITLKASLPKAPTTIVMNDALLPNGTNGSPVALKSHAEYMGLTTALTLKAAAVASATSYVWELPTGVNLVTGTQVGADDVKNYTAYPFTVAVNAPTSVGNVYYKVVTKTYPNGITVASASKFQVGGKLANNQNVAPIGGVMMTSGVATESQTGSAGTFVANAVGVPFDVVNSNPVSPLYPIVSSSSPEVKINFAGVTSPASTTLYLGVRASNGVGSSVSVNTVNTNSKAKTLVLTAALPKAPSSIAMTNVAVSSTVKVTDVSTFVGKSTVFTLTATPSKNTISYTWELPEGVTQLSGTNTNVITVKFEGVDSNVLALPIGVKAVNGIGSSVTVNAAPNVASTAKILKLTAAKPSTISTLTGSTTLIPTTGGTQNYSFSPASKANTYVITVPTGCTVTTTGNTDTATVTLETANTEFTVTYPNNYVSTTVANYKKINVVSKNGVGTSADKLFTIKSGTSARYAQDDKEASLVSGVEMYPNPASDVVAINVSATTNGTVNVTIYSFDGTIVSESKDVRVATGVNSLTENVSKLNKGIYLVKITNSTSNEVITKKLIKN